MSSVWDCSLWYIGTLSRESNVLSHEAFEEFISKYTAYHIWYGYWICPISALPFLAGIVPVLILVSDHLQSLFLSTVQIWDYYNLQFIVFWVSLVTLMWSKDWGLVLMWIRLNAVGVYTVWGIQIQDLCHCTDVDVVTNTEWTVCLTPLCGIWNNYHSYALASQDMALSKFFTLWL